MPSLEAELDYYGDLVAALNVLLASAIIQFPSCDQRARHFPCTIIADVHAFVRSLTLHVLFSFFAAG